MGYASCLENNIEKLYDNMHMRGGYRLEPEPKPVFVANSPPLQPVLISAVVPPPPRPDPAAIAARQRAQHEKHVLALYELMPGKKWRH